MREARDPTLGYAQDDGRLVQRVTHDKKVRAIIKGLQNIADDLELITIAEFVENDEILGKLAEIGVDFAQGYGIAAIYQEPMVFPDLNVAENIFIGNWPTTRLGLVDYEALFEQARTGCFLRPEKFPRRLSKILAECFGVSHGDLGQTGIDDRIASTRRSRSVIPRGWSRYSRVATSRPRTS